MQLLWLICSATYGKKGQPDWNILLGNPKVKLHLYDKGESRPGRKMGHFCVIGKTTDEAVAEAKRLHEMIQK